MIYIYTIVYMKNYIILVQILICNVRKYIFDYLSVKILYIHYLVLINILNLNIDNIKFKI